MINQVSAAVAPTSAIKKFADAPLTWSMRRPVRYLKFRRIS
jgi:hypothetical protein